MFRKSRTRWIGTAASFVAAGTATALFAATPAVAAPTALKPQTTIYTTPTRWKLKLSLTNLSINPVPNLATTAYTREGFMGATLTGLNQTRGFSPITDETIELGVQIGCQVDVTSGLNGHMSLKGSASDSLTPAGTIGGGGSFGGSTTGGQGAGGPKGSASLKYDTKSSIAMTGGFDVTLKPGGITSVTIDNKKMKANVAMIQVDSVHMKVDACAGPVTTRIYGKLHITTKQSIDDMFVYAPTHWI